MVGRGHPDLVVVHCDVELVIKLEGLSPDHPAAPESVASVQALGLGGHIQDVLLTCQRPHALPCAAPAASAQWWSPFSARLGARLSLLASNLCW